MKKTFLINKILVYYSKRKQHKNRQLLRTSWYPSPVCPTALPYGVCSLLTYWPVSFQRYEKVYKSKFFLLKYLTFFSELGWVTTKLIKQYCWMYNKNLFTKNIYCNICIFILLQCRMKHWLRKCIQKIITTTTMLKNNVYIFFLIY